MQLPDNLMSPELSVDAVTVDALRLLIFMSPELFVVAFNVVQLSCFASMSPELPVVAVRVAHFTLSASMSPLDPVLKLTFPVILRVPLMSMSPELPVVKLFTFGAFTFTTILLLQIILRLVEGLKPTFSSLPTTFTSIYLIMLSGAEITILWVGDWRYSTSTDDVVLILLKLPVVTL